jgi:hypothetical protein
LSVELSIEGEAGSGEDKTNESQDVFFEATSQQTYGLGEKRHNIEADHYVMSVESE